MLSGIGNLDTSKEYAENGVPQRLEQEEKRNGEKVRIAASYTFT